MMRVSRVSKSLCEVDFTANKLRLEVRSVALPLVDVGALGG